VTGIVVAVQPVAVNVTLPLCLLTVTLKTAAAVPVTLFDVGDTWIWALLLDVPVIVPAVVTLVRLTLTFIEPLLRMLNDVGFATNEHSPAGVGLGLAPGDGLAPGVGVGVAVGVGVGVGYAVGVGVGVGDAFGSGVGVEVGVGVGVGDGPVPGAGLGSGIKPPGVPVYVAGGTEESEKNCASNVTSPDPVTPTLTVFRPFEKPNDSSPGMRPRQSNVTPLIPVMKRTPGWRVKVLVTRLPSPLKSMVTE